MSAQVLTSAATIVDSDIEGVVAPGFERVRDAFAANFWRDDACRELGAALAVYRGDECVVDLWGGFSSPARAQRWSRDTLVNVYSTTKGAAALCVAILVDRGVLRYEDRVAAVWPEFAANGKHTATIGDVLSHEVGLPAFDAPVAHENLYDWDACCRALAAQTPRWRPGEKTGYHALTFGYLAGEIVRRAAGASIGRFLANEIAGPLQADFFIGLPLERAARTATLVAPAHMVDPTLIPLPDETRGVLTNPALQPAWANLPAWRAAELPSVNGHASAQGVARVYAPLANGGLFERRRVLGADALKQMIAPRPLRTDLMLGMTLQWARGVALNGQTGFLGPNPHAFGHSGWGGSFGCADPDANLAIGYVCNQMGPDLAGDLRARALCGAIYSCIR
jgi:CubicO group peptidase (beta-lactamase class C family)